MKDSKEVTIVAPSTSGRKAAGRWSFFVPALIVAATGVALYFAGLLPAMPNSGGRGESAQVLPGKDYYVFPALIEVSERNAEGNLWDHNSTGPDIFVEVFWRGVRVYQSTTKTDTLLAKWSNAEVDLLDFALRGEKASVDSVIKAARINVAPGEKILFRIYDSDTLGSSDLIDEKEIETTDLQLGDTTYSYPEGNLRRLVLRVLDMNTPPDLLR